MAGPWKNALMKETYSTDIDGTQIEFKTFVAFVEKFKKAFESLLPVQDAIIKLKTLK